ncbi:hypothetical protein DTL42_24975 [Bremerella cremea]|uniref:Uncharacterized protein n=1 Tax=Bremerella cremea TaxID=1031537 RepID=A0A368KLX4_9BACT|nr:hypothetical protein [Bremerella cremea]RCS40627.1 hypothetical protein DTL42_24975 [Bremerella cremea]
MGSDPLFDDDDLAEIVEEKELARPWRPRFGIATIMFATGLLSVAFLMGHLMLNEGEQGLLPKRFGFLFVTLAAPMLIVTVLSVSREVIRLWQKQGQQKRR